MTGHYQLVLVDLSLAFGFQPSHSFVMLPEADRWQREVAVGNRPVVTLLILPIDSRKVTGIVLDKLTSLGTTSPWAEYVVPIVQVKQPNPIASNLPTFHRQKVQEKAFPILRLTRRARPLSKAMPPGGCWRLVQSRMHGVVVNSHDGCFWLKPRKVNLCQNPVVGRFDSRRWLTVSMLISSTS